MPHTERRAKLLPDLLGARRAALAGDPGVVSVRPAAASTIPISSLAIIALDWRSAPAADAAMGGQDLLYPKGAATAVAFQPSYWSYDSDAGKGGFRASPSAMLAATAEVAHAASSTLPTEETNDAIEPALRLAGALTLEDRAAQLVLAAGLAEMIESILRTRQFATLSHNSRCR
jgi:hypothetical protein